MANRIRSWLPNALTISRLLLTPFIILLVLNNKFFESLALLTLALLSDFFDGWFARRWNVVSSLGTILDPFCDKACSVGVFLALMTKHSCPPWFMALLITVGALQLCGLALLQFSRGPKRPTLAPLYLGKWNSALQVGWILILCLSLAVRGNRAPDDFSKAFELVGYLGLSVLQVLVFCRYFQRYRPYLLSDSRIMLLSSKASER